MEVFLIFLIVVAVGIFFAYKTEKKKQAKWEYEKSIGMWDFVDQEYLDYLNSHKIKPKKLEKVGIKLKVSNDTWSLSTDIYYNKAGIYLDLSKVSMKNLPEHFFIRGKEQPSKFSPRKEWFSKSIEKDKKGYIKINLLWFQDETETRDYLIIKNSSDELYNELKECVN